MSSEEHYRKLERMYHQAPCNEYYSPSMTISRGKAELIVPISPKFFHSAGATHGSVYFKALDDVCYFSVSSLVETVFVLTVSFNIYLVQPISKGEMRAVGQVVHASPNLYIAEGRIFDSRDKEIARGSGNFVRGRMALVPDIGYL